MKKFSLSLALLGCVTFVFPCLLLAQVRDCCSNGREPRKGISLHMEFVYIPPGTFLMGSPPDETGRRNDETRHQVTLTKGFSMGVTEVTQWQWKKVMGNNPSHFKDRGDDCPVDWVSWNEVQEFIKRLNQKDNTYKYRLPTEAEWEYACRAGSSTGWSFGDDEGWLGEYAWCDGNSGGKTHPVKMKKPNAWGLYDMHGNVWEWCADKCDWEREMGLITSTYSNGIVDPFSRTGSSLVIRGGSWRDPANWCRSAARMAGSLHARYPFLGFRLVRDIPTR